MPETPRLIPESTFDPEIMKTMCNVFDDVWAVYDSAWALIQPALSGQQQTTIDDARTTLAEAIIDRVNLGLVHPDILTDEAISAAQLSYPSLPMTTRVTGRRGATI